MQQLILTLVIALEVFVSADLRFTTLVEVDCTIEFFYAPDCCKLFDMLKGYTEASHRKCAGKYVKNEGSSPTEIRDINECVFYEDGLLTDERSLNKTAITEFFSPSYLAFSPLMNDIIDKCFLSSKSDVDSVSQESESGVFQFTKCLSREVFLNCPVSLWSGFIMCNKLKVHVEKCPEVGIVSE